MIFLQLYSWLFVDPLFFIIPDVFLSLADRPAVRRGPPYSQWSPSQPPYEYHGVPFRGRGAVGYQPSRGSWFARRMIAVDHGPRRRPQVTSRSRSRSRSRSSRTRSRSRSSSRSHSAETGGRSRKRDVSVFSKHYRLLVY